MDTKINCACLQVKAVNLNFANNIPDIHRFDFQCRPSDLKYYYLCKLKKKRGREKRERSIIVSEH